jgi:hypothetical protein
LINTSFRWLFPLRLHKDRFIIAMLNFFKIQTQLVLLYLWLFTDTDDTRIENQLLLINWFILFNHRLHSWLVLRTFRYFFPILILYIFNKILSRNRLVLDLFQQKHFIALSSDGPNLCAFLCIFAKTKIATV